MEARATAGALRYTAFWQKHIFQNGEGSLAQSRRGVSFFCFRKNLEYFVYLGYIYWGAVRRFALSFFFSITINQSAFGVTYIPTIV